MQLNRAIIKEAPRAKTVLARRAFISTPPSAIALVSTLPSWDLAGFHEHAFQPASPARLPSSQNEVPRACQKWFSGYDDQGGRQSSQLVTELNYPFWEQYESLTVPIEVTRTSHDGTKVFHRSDGPLKLFLDQSKITVTGEEVLSPALSNLSSLYIAQCPLSGLPRSLQEDLPAPELVMAGKGDIYDSSLWMGRPPTFTPLHKDPNPNFFLQLSGQKVVRLFRPEVGRVIFEAIQTKLRRSSNAAFRGEEMMQGHEREELEKAVWSDEKDEWYSWRNCGLEATLGMGDALFIPKGWWHSVRGVGEGMNASVNWWFR